MPLNKLRRDFSFRQFYRTFTRFSMVFLPLFVLSSCKIEDDRMQNKEIQQSPNWNNFSLLPPLTGPELVKEAEKRLEDLRELDKEPVLDYTLQLENWQWFSRSGYAIVEGRVRNVGQARIRNLEVVVEFYDRSGNFITSDSALSEFSPLMPNQSTPFRVMARYNPLMATASIRFKELLGSELSYRDARKHSTDALARERQILRLQRSLQTLGYMNSSVDGKIGPETRRAISEFRSDYGIAHAKVDDLLSAIALVASEREPLRRQNKDLGGS